MTEPPMGETVQGKSVDTLIGTMPEKRQDLLDAHPQVREPAPLSKDSKILIVGGGGTIGSSTALHLARRGYTNIHILDVFPIPSGNSAGNDLNKVRHLLLRIWICLYSSTQIIGFSLDQRGFRGELSRKYMEGWTTDPVFSPYYHNTG
jgi:sarcosine oxidase/L-pipecolate oxidase